MMNTDEMQKLNIEELRAAIERSRKDIHQAIMDRMVLESEMERRKRELVVTPERLRQEVWQVNPDMQDGSLAGLDILQADLDLELADDLTFQLDDGVTLELDGEGSAAIQGDAELVMQYAVKHSLQLNWWRFDKAADNLKQRLAYLDDIKRLAVRLAGVD